MLIIRPGPIKVNNALHENPPLPSRGASIIRLTCHNVVCLFTSSPGPAQQGRVLGGIKGAMAMTAPFLSPFTQSLLHRAEEEFLVAPSYPLAPPQTTANSRASNRTRKRACIVRNMHNGYQGSCSVAAMASLRMVSTLSRRTSRAMTRTSSGRRAPVVSTEKAKVSGEGDMRTRSG